MDYLYRVDCRYGEGDNVHFDGIIIVAICTHGRYQYVATNIFRHIVVGNCASEVFKWGWQLRRDKAKVKFSDVVGISN